MPKDSFDDFDERFQAAKERFEERRGRDLSEAKLLLEEEQVAAEAEASRMSKERFARAGRNLAQDFAQYQKQMSRRSTEITATASALQSDCQRVEDGALAVSDLVHRAEEYDE